MYGVTHLIMAPPALGRVPYVQNSLLDKVSVAGRGMSDMDVTRSGSKEPKRKDRMVGWGSPKRPLC